MIDEQEEYEVEAILKHRKNKQGRIEYLVKWQGYPNSDNTWQTSKDLNNAKQILDVYKKAKKLG